MLSDALGMEITLTLASLLLLSFETWTGETRNKPIMARTMTLSLFVGNKNYSSWSMRPWLALRAAGIEFQCQTIPLDFGNGHASIKRLSKSGKVPFLQDDQEQIGESMAIIEYAADLYPDKKIWPEDRIARGLARFISMEMATSFTALRSACPMNLRRPKKALQVDDKVKADVARITDIWKTCLERFGGPFLFGPDFSAADAMYAPVVNRFETYDLTNDTTVLEYMSSIKAHPAWKEWEKDALAEAWTLEPYEGL